ERRAARTRNLLDTLRDGGRKLTTELVHVKANRIDRAFADHSRRLTIQRGEIHAAHASLGGERNEPRVRLRDVTSAQLELLFGQHNDGAAFRRFIGQRRELSGISQTFWFDIGGRNERRRHTVAQRDGASLVEQQDVNVPGRFNRATTRRHDVPANEPINAADADGAQQSTNRRWNEANQERDENGNGKVRT